MVLAYEYRTAVNEGTVVERRLELTHALKMTFEEIARLRKIVGEAPIQHTLNL